MLTSVVVSLGELTWPISHETQELFDLCKAALRGIRAVLSQVDAQGVEHVVAYASRILTKAERNYCITHRELLAVVTFCSIFNRTFVYCSD